MLIEDEDSSSRLHHFDCHSSGPVYLLHYLGVDGECGLRKGVWAEGDVEEAADKRKRSEEGELTICNYKEVVKDALEGNEVKFKSGHPQGEDRNHVDVRGSSGGSGRGRGNTLEANQLDLIFHESVKAIYEGTNTHVEIPTITSNGRMYDAPCHLGEEIQTTKVHKNHVYPDRIHMKEMMDQVNYPHKIENLKIFLRDRLENVNEKNRQLFLQSMNTITEILNYNFLCISRNGSDLDPASFAWHDSFVSHAMGRAWKHDSLFSPCSVNNANTGEITGSGKTTNVGKGNWEKGEKTQGKKIPSVPSSCPSNIYEKLKNVRCLEKPGLTYKYVYPPKYNSDLTREVKVPKGRILFNAKFESANLQYVLKEKNKEVYSIFLNQDMRSNEKKNQWFYFSASYVPEDYYQNEIVNEINRDAHLDNKESLKVSFDFSDMFLVNNLNKLDKPFSVKFKIENMSRPYFLYKEGHSPLVFSVCKSVKENIQWERAAYNVIYTKNENPKYFNIKTNTFEKLSYCTYTLEFSYDFLYPYDTVYFASSLPYSYSNLLHYLGLLKSYVHRVQEGEKKINYVQGTLCRTPCGFPCPILAITNYDTGEESSPNGESYDRSAMNNTVQRKLGSSKIEGLYRNSVPKGPYQEKQVHSVESTSVPSVENQNLVYVANEAPCQCSGGNTYIEDARCMYNLCHRKMGSSRKEKEDNPRQRRPRKYSNSFMRQFELLLERHSMHPLNHDGGKRPSGSVVSPSLSGSSTHVVSPSTVGEPTVQSPREEKKIIFLTARVHPGETNASYVMHGFLSFITSDNAYADALRDNFIFIVIPMLNVDGVVLGHNRFCSNGFDLNRQWNRPIYYLHQTVHTAKSLIKKIHRNGKIIFFCDFHGHSRKYNCFLFGNSDSRAHLRGKKLPEVFPHILGSSLPWFSLEDTKFKGENMNRGVARHVCGSEFSIDCSYTFEVSLIGIKMKSNCNGVVPVGGSTNGVGKSNEPIGSIEVTETREGGEGATCNNTQKYDFCFYDENILMLTGISFGISLFKFFNFLSHHRTAISGGGNQTNKPEMSSPNGNSEMPPSRFKTNGRVQLGGQLPCHRNNLKMLGRKKKGEIVMKSNLKEVLPLGSVWVGPTSDGKSALMEPTTCLKSHLNGGDALEGDSRSSKPYVKVDGEISFPPGVSTPRSVITSGNGNGNCNKRGGEGEPNLRKDVAKRDSSVGKGRREGKEKGLSNRKKEEKEKRRNQIKESRVQEGTRGTSHNRASVKNVPTYSMKKKNWLKLLPYKNPFFCSLNGKISSGGNGRGRLHVKVCRLPGNGDNASKKERHGNLSSGSNYRTRRRIEHPCLGEDLKANICEVLQTCGKKPHGYDPQLGGKKRSVGHSHGKFSRQRKRPLRITRRKLVIIKKVNSVKGRKANGTQAKQTKKEEKKNGGLCLNHGELKREYLICLKRKKLKRGLGLIKLLRRKVKASGVGRASDDVVGEAKRKKKKKKKSDPGKGISMNTVVNGKRES
ncbi:putative Zinc-carboxypeptidase [Plasmodium knowlesi]|uniref:Putative Zinc-carboxypeptidase n=1 Tax=Plasmodium knowlesi TaxID=5850 RepID=A0A1Y3DUP5_PLAKN|nr:putative Zinc-carboxypeptidase [Plasmodium knowlesi]